MSDLPIFNCHIHAFTDRDVPENFLKMEFGPFLGVVLGRIARWKPVRRWLVRVGPGIRQRWGDNRITRALRFVARGETDSQTDILAGIMRQYPPDATFVVLPMDMEFAGLGRVDEPIAEQHAALLEIASSSAGRVIPFFAADPRREDLVERAREALVPGKFRGVKIYPNLGYRPDDPRLMELYALCEKRGVPVTSHCSDSGTWKYGMSLADRVAVSHPRNYERILATFPKLRLCLAHFGGADEWVRHLKSEDDRQGDARSWVSWIADMIRSGDYPNLYTDISYTLFTPQVAHRYVDFLDYLKVLLADKNLSRRVLFGSDYYMVELESMSEKEMSIALRSRLGEKLYFRIAHRNPKRWLGI